MQNDIIRAKLAKVNLDFRETKKQFIIDKEVNVNNKSTKQILLEFIERQEKFNTNQEKFNAKQEKFNEQIIQRLDRIENCPTMKKELSK